MYKILIFSLVIFSSFSHASDIDSDGLDDVTEEKIGTSITSKDTDGDGGSDGDEVDCLTDPLNPNHKIINLGKYESTGRVYVRGNGLFSKGYYVPTGIKREVIVSLNGKIETKTFDTFSYSKRSLYLIKLESSYQEIKRKEENKKRMQQLELSFKKINDGREMALAQSPRYEEIKKMRIESERLKKAHELSKSIIDKNTYIEYNKSLTSLVNEEYKKYEHFDKNKYPLGVGYFGGSSYDDLEDKVEELEDKVSDYEDKIRDLEDAIEEME